MMMEINDTDRLTNQPIKWLSNQPIIKLHQQHTAQ